MRKFTKILLPVLCVMALLTCTFGSFGVLSVSAAGTVDVDVAQSILDKYDVDSWNGTVQTGVAGDGVVTAWDILKVDGYIEGVWLPWLTHSWLGSSLAANPDMENNDSFTLADGTVKDYWQTMTQIGIDNYNNTQLEMEIFNLRALGFNMLAYAGSPWGEGRVNDTNTWACTGVRDDYLKNIRRLLDICRKANMPVVWYIHFHSSAVPGYASLDMHYRIDQVKASKEYADGYAENFVKPVCEVLKEYRDVVVMCGIADETFNEINDSEAGDKFAEGDREQYGVTQEDAMYFHSRIGQMVKQVMPDMPTTCADNADQYAMYGDAMLDMPGRNQYSSGSSPSSSVAAGWATGPLLAGEYGMSGSAGQFTEDNWSSTMISKRENYLSAGYSGFFQWAYEPTFKSYEGPNGNQMTRQNATSPYDLRMGVYKAYYWAMKKQTGNSSAANAPAALYYCGTNISFKYSTSKSASATYNHSGNGKVYYVRPENNASVTIERSVNGGAWTAVSGGSTAYDTNAGSHRACFTDPNPVTSGTVQYRVSANGYTSYTNVWEY